MVGLITNNSVSNPSNHVDPYCTNGRAKRGCYDDCARSLEDRIERRDHFITFAFNQVQYVR